MAETDERLSLTYRLLRRVVFSVGHVRWTGRPPLFVGCDREPLVSYEECLSALPLIQPGDIVLHRLGGFLANVCIGGAMIHAGLAVGNDQVVEAVSHGVVKRHLLYILSSDYACVIRPNLDDDAKREAVEWANDIVGFHYDWLFQFNGDRERQMVAKYYDEAKRKGVRFCCTEVPYFCYLGHNFGLKRRRNKGLSYRLASMLGFRPGKMLVDADFYVTSGASVVWMSESFTERWAEAMGCSDSYLHKVHEYWDQRRS